MKQCTAMRRLEQLYDPGTFSESFRERRGGYLVGEGLVEGRRVCVCASRTEPGGWTPLDSLKQELLLLEHLQRNPAPLVFVMDAQGFGLSAAGRSPVPLDADELQLGEHCVGRTYYLQARLMRNVPMVGVLCGHVAAALSFPLAMCDAVVMLEGTGMSIGRPDAVKLMTGEEITPDELGGARKQCTLIGQGHALAPTEAAAFAWVRKYLASFPSRAGEAVPVVAAAAPSAAAVPLDRLVPADCLKPFRMQSLIEGFVDRGSLVELKELHAQHAITALARVEGRVCGIVANAPTRLGGILFPDGCRKMAEFISLCDAFGIPLLFLADNPGFMVGRHAEEGGSIRAGAELFSAIARCRTPRLCIVVRKAYTAGLYAMGGAGFSPERLLALPTASISIYGRKALELLRSDGGLTPEGARAVDEMLQGVESPKRLEDKGMIDRVIDWDEIRGEVASFLRGAAANGCRTRTEPKSGRGADRRR